MFTNHTNIIFAFIVGNNKIAKNLPLLACHSIKKKSVLLLGRKSSCVDLDKLSIHQDMHTVSINSTQRSKGQIEKMAKKKVQSN